MFLTLLGLAALFSPCINAQDIGNIKGDRITKQIGQNDGLASYVSMSVTPTDKRRSAFSEMASFEKASLFKFHLAFQLVKRPELTEDQQTLILETISRISNDTYEMQNAEKRATAEQNAAVLQSAAVRIFRPKDVSNIFAGLGGNEADISLLERYRNITFIESNSARKQAFRELSAKDKSDVWRTQMAYYLATDDTLNDSQRKFILRVIKFLTPANFETPDGPVDRKMTNGELGALELDAKAVFDDAKIRRLFASLGNPGICAVKASPVLRLEGTPDCSCSLSYNDCSQTTTCSSGGCEQTWYGCGFLWLQWCTGECRLHGEDQ